MRKVHICRFLTSVLLSVLLVLGSFSPYIHAEEYSAPAPEETSDDRDFSGHYMSVVGYVKYDNCGMDFEYLLIVESWGKLFYLNYNEYAKLLGYRNNVLLYQV